MWIEILVALAIGQHPAMPPGMTHEEHLAQMQKEAELDRRGAEAMGFSQKAATHHFAITGDGGAIEVTVISATDAETRDAIRSHLRTIADEFARGVFEKPSATHGEVPDGVLEMQRLRASIRYQYQEVPGGGRVRILTSDPEALDAVHRFLRYQIREHQTGDPR